MSAPLVVGLDLSITATGIAVHPDFEPGPDSTYTITPTKGSSGDDRLIGIVGVIAHYCRGVDLAVIEGPVLRSQAALSLGLLHGAVRYRLMCDRVPYVVVAPATLKKFATGKGNAGKPEMAVALYKRTGLELADDNQVDAFFLRAAGLHALGHPLFDLPAAHVAALDKVTWPTREEEA